MHSNSFALALNRFDVPVEGNDLGLDADLFSELARGRHGKRLAYFDHAARQGETPDHRLARSTDDKHPALTKDGHRDREDRPGGEEPVIHGPIR